MSRTVKSFFSSFTEFESKLFVTGVCSDVCQHLDGILTDEQKQSTIAMVDECYTAEEQAKIKMRFIDSVNEQVAKLNS